MVIVKRALLSCHDKTGLDVFAKALAGLGVELIASGGTAAFLAKHGLHVKSVEAFAGITEQLDGRVKTLHPKIHAGILAKREDPAHVQAVGAEGLIDLVVVNLYPFQETIQKPETPLIEAVEQIDIGGVALLRAAAKNFAHVGASCRPDQYERIGKALQFHQGRLPDDLALQLAAEAFNCTMIYDAYISSYLGRVRTPGVPPLNREVRAQASQDKPTKLWRHTGWVTESLRYGENPHQRGLWMRPDREALQQTDLALWGLGTLRQHQGKELSYNNLLDLDGALQCLLDFDEPACVIIKHASQCGLAMAAGVRIAYERASGCDPESTFGGIVGVNRSVDLALAQRLTETFLEVVLAPSVEPQALETFKHKPNLRVVTIDWPTAPPDDLEWRQLCGAWLAQQPDRTSESWETFKVVTKRSPSAQELADLRFAWLSVKHVRSNGIVLASERATVGIGQGQPSRVGSVRLAIEKAGERARQAVAASDGFFPFPDSVELLAKAGVTAIIQPGGSIRDAEVTAAADAAGITMLLTGIRHFRH